MSFSVNVGELHRALEHIQTIRPTKKDGCASHGVIIRAGGGAADIYASNGGRCFVIAPLPAAVDGECCVEAATADLASAVEILPRKGEVVVGLDRGRLSLAMHGAETAAISAHACADPLRDGLVAQATVDAVVPATTLLETLDVARAYTRARENWRDVHLNVILICGGVLTAMDGLSVLRAEVPWAQSWRMVLHRQDVTGVRVFLRLHRGENIELLGHDRCFMIRTRQGALYSVTHYPGRFAPALAPQIRGQGWCEMDSGQASDAINRLWKTEPKPAKAAAHLQVDPDAGELLMRRGRIVERVALSAQEGMGWMSGRELELPLEQCRKMLQHSPSSTRLIFGYTLKMVLCSTAFTRSGTNFQVLIPGKLSPEP